jgi:hypothetical protein
MNTQRSLLLWPLLYALFYFYGTLFYSDLKFSTFHTLSVDTIDRTSSQRLQNAIQWFDTTTHQATNQTGTPKYCIAIVTTLRPQRYLLQTMHALFKSINKSNQSADVSLQLIVQLTATGNNNNNNNNNNNKNMLLSDTQRDDLKRIALHLDKPIVYVRPVDADDFFDAQHTYVHALQQCTKNKKNEQAEVVIVLEDDALASTSVDLFDQLHHHLMKVSSSKNWATIKMFQTEYYWGWEWSFVDIFLLLLCWCCTFVLVVLCAVPTEYSKKRYSRVGKDTKERRRIFRFRPYILWHGICSSFLLVSILLSIGKQNIPFLSPYSKDGIFEISSTNSLDSNTVATVFQRSKVESLVSYLKNTRRLNKGEEEDVPIDVAISKWCVLNGFGRWYVVPSLFQHIGFWSSSEQKSKQMLHRLRFNTNGGKVGFKESRTFDKEHKK